MTDRPDRPLLDRRRFLLAGVGAVLAACAGTEDATSDRAATPGSTNDATPSPTPSTGRTVPPSTEQSPTEEPVTDDEIAAIEYPTGVVPATLTIAAIGVDANVVDLLLSADEVEVPEDFDDAGWWVQTRRPGEIGPAVIGGHVDSRTGPAVFFRLADLRPGDEVTVAGDDGDTRSFVVSEDPIRVRKDQRPPEVFGFTTGRPELRLITCGGDFDPNTGHYVDNVVVFCHDPGYTA